MSEDKIADKIAEALDTLRGAGYAVAAFTPEELGNAGPRYVEDMMVERGWLAIYDTQDEDEES